MTEIINELMDIGLTEYEAQVYSAMLSQDLLKAVDITKICSVPRGRVYDILNQLVDKGFCVVVPGVVKKFKAVDPEAAIKNLIEQQKKQEQKMLEIAKKLVNKYNNKKENSTPLDYIQVLTSKQSQMKKFQELEEISKEHILTFNKKPYATNMNDLEELMKVSSPLTNIINNGIVAKGIYEVEEDNIINFTKYVSYFENIGEQVRICEELPIKMLISDNSNVMISLRNEGSVKFNVSSMIVQHSDLTSALIKLFEFYWSTSMTIEEYLKSKNLNKPVIKSV